MRKRKWLDRILNKEVKQLVLCPVCGEYTSYSNHFVPRFFIKQTYMLLVKLLRNMKNEPLTFLIDYKDHHKVGNMFMKERRNRK